MAHGRPPPALGSRELLALHRRHAGRVRAVFYWLGADLEVLDDAVLRTFRTAARLGADDLPHAVRPWLGRLAWRVASRPADLHHSDRVIAPRLPLAADALARFLADHAANPLARGLFVLSEFTGVTPVALAAELHDPALVPALHAALVELRHAFASDPGVVQLGGPQAVLSASLAPFLDDPAWQQRHAALLAPDRPVLADILRRPASIVGLGAAAIALLLLVRPTTPPLRVVAVREQTQAPTPSLRLFPPVPSAMPPAPGPPRKVLRARSTRPSAATTALAERERLAETRDPGAIIVELEMLGAARKALTINPHQSLAYADQHARDYPESQLADQRAEVRVRALCALKRNAEATTEANRRQTPRVQTALREACR